MILFFFRSLPTMKKSLHTNYLINKRNKDWIFYSHPLEVFHGRSSNSKSQTDHLAIYNYDFWFRFPSLLNDDDFVPKTFFSNPAIAFWNNLYKSSNKMIKAKLCFNCTKNGLILQLAAEKKAPFLVQLKQIFGPSYLVRALVPKLRPINGHSFFDHF